MHAFISHNHRDKPQVTPLAARLRLLGVDVWLDSWKIRPGDRIFGKINEALRLVDTVIVFWSANSSKSPWVNTEWEAALTRRLRDDSVRVIPVVVLDDTPLPPLLEPIMWVSMVDGDVDRAARELVGVESQAELVKTMQRMLRSPDWSTGTSMGSASSLAVPGAELQVRSWKAGAPLITPETTCTREFVVLSVGGTRAAKSDYTAHTAQSFVGSARRGVGPTAHPAARRSDL